MNGLYHRFFFPRYIPQRYRPRSYVVVMMGPGTEWLHMMQRGQPRKWRYLFLLSCRLDEIVVIRLTRLKYLELMIYYRYDGKTR